MDYTIRKSEYEDCKDISKLITITWNETYRGLLEDEYLDELNTYEEERTKSLEEKFGKDSIEYFVLEVDEKIIGFVRYGKSEYENYTKVGEIYALYILKQYHRLGFGKKLFDKSIEELKRQGCENIIVGCVEGNPSNDFYRALKGKMIGSRIFTRKNHSIKENVYLFKS